MKREMSASWAVLPILMVIVAASLSVFVWDAGMHMPLIFGVIVAGTIASVFGWQWTDIQKMMGRGVERALPAVFILLVIGVIVGSWIASGVIPSMIYYGLAMIHPSVFVPLVALITGIVSITLGSSFTSIATVGLAFMIIGEGFGFSAGLVGGAVISGAFFGDKLSPLSDTTNIAPALAETDLFSHIKHMLWDTLPAFVLALILYAVISNTGAGVSQTDSDIITNIMTGLDKLFLIHPLLLLMPILTILLMIFRVPALPALTGVALLGAMLAILVQGVSISSIVQMMTDGFVAESGDTALDSLLNRGGLTSMLDTVGLLVIATAYGGILEGTGMIDALTKKMMAKIHSTGSLVLSTILSTFLVAFTTGAQFLAIILPARTFVDKYKEMNIDTKNLSRCVESAGTVGINLVPWGVPAVFAAGVFGISPGQFIPFAFFVMLVPLINILFGYTGWTITKKTYIDDTIDTKKKEIAS